MELTRTKDVVQRDILTPNAIKTMCRRYDNDEPLDDSITIQIIKVDRTKRQDTNRWHVSTSSRVYSQHV